jgi:hypothetical protein
MHGPAALMDLALRLAALIGRLRLVSLGFPAQVRAGISSFNLGGIQLEYCVCFPPLDAIPADADFTARVKATARVVGSTAQVLAAE